MNLKTVMLITTLFMFAGVAELATAQDTTKTTHKKTRTLTGCPGRWWASSPGIATSSSCASSVPAAELTWFDIVLSDLSCPCVSCWYPC